jgi:NFU1 iron-sulfur cluster scaffold homolog, mitochondrial
MSFSLFSKTKEASCESQSIDKIQIQATPGMDGLTCHFQVSKPLLPKHSLLQKKTELRDGSPLLNSLFAIDGIETVFICGSALTVSCSSNEDWKSLGKKVGTAVRDCLSSQTPLFSDKFISDKFGAKPKSENGLESPAGKAVQNLLDLDINPALASHGGHVELVEIREPIAFVKFSGGCQGCGMAQATLKNGVEANIREKVPEIIEVRDVTDHASGVSPYFASQE